MSLPRLAQGRRRRLLVRLVLNGLAQAIAAIAWALLVRQAVRAATGDGTAGPELWLPLLLAAIAAMVGLRVLERIDATRLSEHYVKSVRLRLFDAQAGEGGGRRDDPALAPTLLRFVTDLTAIRQWVSEGLARLLVGSLATAGALLALTLIDLRFAALAALLFLGALAGAAALQRPLEGRIRSVRRERARLAVLVGDRLRGVSAVRLSGQHRRERRALARRSDRLADAALARARLAVLLRNLPELVLGLTTAGVLLLGAGLGGLGGRPPVDASIAALAVLGALAPQARALARAFEYWNNHRVAGQRLARALAGATLPGRGRARRQPAQAEGRLVVRRLSVAGALSGIDAVAEPGSLVALVGPSGAGKSCLLAAAARLVTPDEGSLRLDGHDLRRLDPAWFARHVGMVSPALPLVRGSLRRNLCYRVGARPEAEVLAICRRCDLEGALSALPQGLATGLGGPAAPLPQGLQRRIELARAVMGDPALLLLDDPDAGLDAAGRAALDRLLAERRGTVLLATHSAARALAADQVWYLEGGRLIEAGPPQTLLAAGGAAARFLAGAAPLPATVTPLRRPAPSA